MNKVVSFRLNNTREERMLERVKEKARRNETDLTKVIKEGLHRYDRRNNNKVI